MVPRVVSCLGLSPISSVDAIEASKKIGHGYIVERFFEQPVTILLKLLEVASKR